MTFELGFKASHRERFRQKLLAWHAAHRLPHPWRSVTEQHTDPYRAWVAEIMLQQTTVEVAQKRYPEFIRRFPDLKSLAAADPQDLIACVAGLGYYNRYWRMHRCAQLLIAEGGAFPSTYQELLQLPGFGPYTAAALASICFQHSTPAVDGNVKRVMSRFLDLRIPLHHAALKKALLQLLALLICPQRPGRFNEALMELGQTLCTPRKPRCCNCPLSFGCQAFQRSTQHLSPAPAAKTPLTPLTISVLMHIHQHAVQLCRRPQNAPVLKGTWGFPLLFEESVPYQPHRATHQHLGSFSHRITRYKIEAHLYLCNQSTATTPQNLHSRWINLSEAPKRCISSLDHKAWKLYKTQISSNQKMPKCSVVPLR